MSFTTWRSTAALATLLLLAGFAAPVGAAPEETRFRIVFLNLQNKLPIPSWADRLEWDIGLDASGAWWFSDNSKIDKALSAPGAPPALAALQKMLTSDQTLLRALKALARVGRRKQVYFLLVDDRNFPPKSQIWPHASWKQGNLMDLASAGMEDTPQPSGLGEMMEAMKVQKAQYLKIGEVQAAADLRTGEGYLKGVLVHEFAHTQDESSMESGTYGLDGTHFYNEIQTGPRGAWLEGFANFCGLAFSKELLGFVHKPATVANGFRIESTTQQGQYSSWSFGQLSPQQLMQSEAIVSMILLKLAEYASPGSGGGKASVKDGILTILEAVAQSNEGSRDLPRLMRTFLRMDSMGGGDEEGVYHRFLRASVVLDVFTGFQYSDAELLKYFQGLELLAHGAWDTDSLSRVGGGAPKPMRFLAAYLGSASSLRHRARLMYYEQFGAKYNGRPENRVQFMNEAVLGLVFDTLFGQVEADFKAWEDGTFNPSEEAAGTSSPRSDADDLGAGNPWEGLNR